MEVSTATLATKLWPEMASTVDFTTVTVSASVLPLTPPKNSLVKGRRLPVSSPSSQSAILTEAGLGQLVMVGWVRSSNGGLGQIYGGLGQLGWVNSCTLRIAN